MKLFLSSSRHRMLSVTGLLREWSRAKALGLFDNLVILEEKGSAR